MDESVRWSLKVSKKTDEALRAHLGHDGARKEDASRFIEEAVRAKLSVTLSRAKLAESRRELAAAVSEIRARTRTVPRARFEKLVTEAMTYARKRR